MGRGWRMDGSGLEPVGCSWLLQMHSSMRIPKKEKLRTTDDRPVAVALFSSRECKLDTIRAANN